MLNRWTKLSHSIIWPMSLMESTVLNTYLYVGHSLSKRKNCRVSFYQFISTPLKMVRGRKTSLAFFALCQDEFFPFSTNILFFLKNTSKIWSPKPQYSQLMMPTHSSLVMIKITKEQCYTFCQRLSTEKKKI